MITVWLFVLHLFFFLCLGSFLNTVASRILINESFISKRSHCPHCKKNISWHDLVPVISFIVLKGMCRSCKKKISWLYPFIELLTALIFSCMLFFVSPAYWAGYTILFIALIINIRTDLHKMVIPQNTSIYLVPIGWLCAYLGLIPLSLYQSINGALFGFVILFAIAHVFLLLTKKKGMGEGDFNLLALIGAFTGIKGAFISLFMGSIIGSILGIFLIMMGINNRHAKLPFGPFLSVGACIYIFFPHIIILLIHM